MCYGYNWLINFCDRCIGRTCQAMALDSLTFQTRRGEDTFIASQEGRYVYGKPKGSLLVVTTRCFGKQRVAYSANHNKVKTTRCFLKQRVAFKPGSNALLRHVRSEMLSPGGGRQIWSGYGCKARPPTGWGIRWEHRLKKWGVIGWEHDFWHSVREKYKNMWGHQVRAKSSQKSRVFGWYLKQSIVRVLPGTWLVFSILDCKITKVKYIVFFSNASFSNHGALSDRLNEKIWVFGWELMQL